MPQSTDASANLRGVSSSNSIVIEVPLPARDREEDDRRDDETEADEDLEAQDFHVRLLRERERVVKSTVLTDARGMSTAQRRGDMNPATARPTVTTL